MQSDSNILQVKNLSKSFGGLKAISDCSLKIKKGSITGIIGPNGSGKTTLLRVLAGLIPISYGSIEYDNMNSLEDNFYILGHRLGIKEEVTPYEDLLFWSSIYDYKNRYKDLFFALSHGVHRGILKTGKNDDRIVFLNKLFFLDLIQV